jgi:hypothetical protein
MGTIKVLEDIEAAFEAYPHEYLTLEIVEVAPPGGVIDENDDVSFRIRVTNSGPLHVNQLSLLVEGLNGTEVKSNGAAAQYDSSFTLSGSWFGDVPAHSSGNPVVTGGSKFYFRPTIALPLKRELVRVSVAEWDSDGFAHLQNGHTRKDPAAKGTYSSTVSPS